MNVLVSVHWSIQIMKIYPTTVAGSELINHWLQFKAVCQFSTNEHHGQTMQSCISHHWSHCRFHETQSADGTLAHCTSNWQSGVNKMESEYVGMQHLVSLNKWPLWKCTLYFALSEFPFHFNPQASKLRSIWHVTALWMVLQMAQCLN